jgi:hypothetical protein
VVGQLLGFAGLFVAVPMLSFITIAIEEFWIKPMETRDVRDARAGLVLPPDVDDQGMVDPDAPPSPFEVETEARQSPVANRQSG